MGSVARLASLMERMTSDKPWKPVLWELDIPLWPIIPTAVEAVRLELKPKAQLGP
jgi:hypothetical protein